LRSRSWCTSLAPRLGMVEMHSNGTRLIMLEGGGSYRSEILVPGRRGIHLDGLGVRNWFGAIRQDSAKDLIYKDV